ncbi:MAG: hypothetical protein GC193_12035 [Cryomorphaceae bacterium]|nr:hypothetical protein [Cryomorphaceae bacterium]
MKRAISMLGALALMTAGFLFAAPAAQANNVPCTPYVISGSGYPADGLHLLNCMRAPQNSSEASRQNQIKNSVNGAPHILNQVKRNLLLNNDVVIYIFSNGQDAFDTLGIIQSANEPAPGMTETGRSWSIPNGPSNPNIPRPIITIWEYSVQQWNNGNPITSGYQYAQTGKTTEHEEGHIFDRLWAVQLGYPPIGTIPSTMTNADIAWLSAYSKDKANLSASAQSIINAQSPRLNKSNELFAVEFGSSAGGGWGPTITLPGGATQSESVFVKNNFKCTTWYMQKLYAANGVPPANPSPAACYGATIW